MTSFRYLIGLLAILIFLATDTAAYADNSALDQALENLEEEVPDEQKHHHHLHDHGPPEPKPVFSSEESFIEQLQASWRFFKYAWLSALILSVSLSVLGLLLLFRRQCMAGPAVSQAGILGVAALLAAEHHLGLQLGHIATILIPVFFAVAAVFIITGTGPDARKGADVRLAVVFLAGTGLSLLAMAEHPHGMQKINSLIGSSLLSADLTDTIIFAILLIVIGVGAYKWRTKLQVLVLDPQYFASRGHNLNAWNRWLNLLIGVSLGLAIHSTGMLFASTLLLFPAVSARMLVKGIGEIVWVSAAIAVTSTLITLILSSRFDNLALGPLLLTVNMMIYLCAYAVSKVRKG